MAELLIIADDLTGAIEAGVQLSKQNITAEVVIDSNGDLTPVLNNKNITALVINTESRHISPEEAAQRISSVLNSVKNTGIKFFYKKTDSTMRGNIGSELEAFLKGINGSVLPYIPAHPKLKRFTRKGFQYIEQVLLHQTSFANDPGEPTKESYVPEILMRQTKTEICCSDPSGFSLKSSVKGKNKICVFDCQTVSDLETIGETILNNNWQNAIAGTAGFVEILPGLLSLRSSKVNAEPVSGPLLIVNGSLNVASLGQVDYVKNQGVTTLFLSRDLVFDSNFKTTDDFKEILKRIRAEFSRERSVVISTKEPIYLKNTDNTNNKFHQSFSRQTGHIISAILDEVNINTLCIFGGDTLMAIMQESGGRYIEAKNEILPGVACAKTNLYSGTITLLSKPGGYGERDVIMKIINHIKNSAE